MRVHSRFLLCSPVSEAGELGLVVVSVPEATSVWLFPGRAVMQTERHRRRAAVKAQREF